MFKTTYDYNNPGPAGPFKGSLFTTEKYKRGEEIRAPFGLATVRSSRASDIPMREALRFGLSR
jgi:hypothetical protein